MPAAAATPKRRTRAQLEAELAATRAERDEAQQLHYVTLVRARAAEADAEKARAEHADLKQRLLAAEKQIERLRGYLDRVHEDDVVREELIPVGDPEGERRLVPKRQSELFGQPRVYKNFARHAPDHHPRGGEQLQRPKHWINY